MVKEINYNGSTKMPKPFPELRKTGAISPNGGEMSVFVYRGKLMQLQNFWEGKDGYPGPCAAICEYFDDSVSYPPFGENGDVFYQAYVERDTVHVYAANKNRIWHYSSDDLFHWERRPAITFPENFKLHNTAVAKGDDGRYMMAIEAAAADGESGVPRAVPNEYIGAFFTEFFASSRDLETWDPLPFEKAYTKERYNACPALEFCGGYYYMICLEELPCVRYAPYIYRTKDFETWEVSVYNPIIVPGETERHPKPGFEDRFTDEEIRKLAVHMNINNSDVDLCEYGGAVYLVYATGNQLTESYYAEAVFAGTMRQFLESFF
ncbi:MAG: hypothetical protein J5849_03605 [Clostridia bacterium]|nr:hypothetical protein [Clostridia bacterium]